MSRSIKNSIIKAINAIADLADPSANKGIFFTSATTADYFDLTARARVLLEQPTPSGMLSAIGEDDAIKATAQGMLGQTFDRQMVRTIGALVSQRAYHVGVVLRTGQVITNVHVHVVTAAGAASTITAKVGLYDKTGARLAVSANLTTAWESTGMKTHAFTTPYVVLANDFYYVAILYNGSAAPDMPLASSTGIAAVGAGVLPFGAVNTQTDLDATETIGNNTPVAWWAGLS